MRGRGEQAADRGRRAAPQAHQLEGHKAARKQAQAHLVTPHHLGAERAQPADAEGAQRRPTRHRTARPPRVKPDSP